MDFMIIIMIKNPGIRSSLESNSSTRAAGRSLGCAPVPSQPRCHHQHMNGYTQHELLPRQCACTSRQALVSRAHLPNEVSASNRKKIGISIAKVRKQNMEGCLTNAFANGGAPVGSSHCRFVPICPPHPPFIHRQWPIRGALQIHFSPCPT